MTNRRLIAIFLASMVVVAIGAALLSRDDGTQGSTLSRRALGWMATRRYVEARGVEVDLLGRAEAPLPPDRTLVTVFPWNHLTLEPSAQLAQRHLRRGGTVLIGYSGSVDDLTESDVFQVLGIGSKRLHPSTTLDPFRWHEQQTAEWQLVPTKASRVRTTALVRTMTTLPVLPKSAVALRRNREGQVLVARMRFGGGRLFVVPAEALCNARLAQPGNADLLEELIRDTGRHWVFDEYHHGLMDGPAETDGRPQWALLAWLAHLGLCYALAIVALARRFGPAWREPALTTGSARSFFMGIGALHARLGHAPEAAALLHSRARELDSTLDLPARPPATDAMDSSAFVRFAQRVAHAQHKRKRS